MGEVLKCVTLHGGLKKTQKSFCGFCKNDSIWKKMQNFRSLGSPPPDPRASRGFAPRPPLASGGWELRSETPKLSPPLRISGYAPAQNKHKKELEGKI